MNVLQIQQKTKLINNEKGKPIEVILPYKIYKDLLDLQMSIEIFNQPETQKDIKKAKEDIKKGKLATFKNVDKAIEWLKK